MTELEQYKQNQRANRIKMIKIITPIGGALGGYLYSTGALWGYEKTPTKNQMIISILMGAIIGFGVSYLAVKKLEKEKK